MCLNAHVKLVVALTGLTRGKWIEKRLPLLSISVIKDGDVASAA